MISQIYCFWCWICFLPAWLSGVPLTVCVRPQWHRQDPCVADCTEEIGGNLHSLWQLSGFLVYSPLLLFNPPPSSSPLLSSPLLSSPHLSSPLSSPLLSSPLLSSPLLSSSTLAPPCICELHRVLFIKAAVRVCSQPTLRYQVQCTLL